MKMKRKGKGKGKENETKSILNLNDRIFFFFDVLDVLHVEVEKTGQGRAESFSSQSLLSAIFFSKMAFFSFRLSNSGDELYSVT